MARYKETEKDQGIMIPIYLDEQLVSETFEHMLSELIDSQMDLRIFDGKYNNDLTGATAIEPRILLKIIIYCYSLGVISSRRIAKMCESNMTVKALAEDRAALHNDIQLCIRNGRRSRKSIQSKRDNKMKEGGMRKGKEKFDIRNFKYLKKENCFQCPNGKKLQYRGRVKLARNEREPVFANITYCKGITRFTLRGDKKVNIQWKLYCIVHNISKCNTAKNRKMA